MDEEMGEAREEVQREGFEIDVEYEFDAPKYFDLRGEEPVMEASRAERWFETAESYPPSPLIMKIILEQNASFQEEESEENPTTPEPNYSIQEELPQDGDKKTQIKTKGPFCKISTFMKPTASHLAKQIHKSETRTIHRLNPVRNFGISADSKDCTVQAAKRQRLERGHISKGIGAAQPDLIHKIREKNENVGFSKLKITIPREPDLQTMRRAERFRARRGLANGKQPQQENNNNNNNNNTQNFAQINSRFSNKKEISFTSKSRLEHNISHQLQINSENKKQEESRVNLFKFKAGPSDKKVVSSNVDISRNTKLNTTIPKEFNFSTSRRCQHPPPLTELFNKLGITNEAKHHASTSKNSSLPKISISKDSKENIRINNLRC
ncbi:hypothetical protein LUZ60_007208 [Juncus effusus]|nr:hypothetical protein LUZ60_007208 [Juncus effusus]